MRQEGSYGNSDTATDVEAAQNLNALNPDWLIDHDPNLAPLTDEAYARFEQAVAAASKPAARRG